MNFDDAVLIRLADPTSRDALFDQDGLAAVAAAGYDQPELTGPYSAVFDDVGLGIDLEPDVQLSGTIQLVGDSTRHEVTASLSGFADPGTPRLTALWRGSVVAQARPAGEPVTLASSHWSSDGSDPVSALQLTMPDPLTVPTVARPLPVTVAVLARNLDTASPGALLADTAVVRDRLVDAGYEPAAAPGLRRRNAVVVAWLVPGALFDDDGWPGGGGGTPDVQRAARRAVAAQWLIPQGIALMTADL